MRAEERSPGMRGGGRVASGAGQGSNFEVMTTDMYLPKSSPYLSPSRSYNRCYPSFRLASWPVSRLSSRLSRYQYPARSRDVDPRGRRPPLSLAAELRPVLPDRRSWQIT